MWMWTGSAYREGWMMSSGVVLSCVKLFRAVSLIKV